jgi:hypothetical protein
MTLPATGAISLGSIHTELGQTSTSIVSLNDTDVRALLGKASGAISLNDGHGKTNIATYTPLYSESDYFPLYTNLNSVTGGRTLTASVTPSFSGNMLSNPCLAYTNQTAAGSSSTISLAIKVVMTGSTGGIYRVLCSVGLATVGNAKYLAVDNNNALLIGEWGAVAYGPNASTWQDGLSHTIIGCLTQGNYSSILYVDGVAVSGTTTPNGGIASSEVAVNGVYGGSNLEVPTGWKMSEFRVWKNRIFNASEALVIHNTMK